MFKALFCSVVTLCIIEGLHHELLTGHFKLPVGQIWNVKILGCIAIAKISYKSIEFGIDYTKLSWRGDMCVTIALNMNYYWHTYRTMKQLVV